MAEVRNYSRLFNHPYPDHKKKNPAGVMAVVNKDSLQLYSAFVDAKFAGAKAGDVFQFERVGYYAVDPDSTSNRLVFNLTVTLREDKGKK